MSKEQSVSDHLKGQAAHEANKRKGLSAFLLRIVGGMRRPTRQAKAKVALMGDQWNREQSELAGTAPKRQFEITAIAKGINAAKLSYVESAGGRDPREAGQAVAQLIKTSTGTKSWAETQNGVINTGPNVGKRVTELQAWQDAISQPGNEELYAAVLQNRPDRAPHIIQAAEAKAGFRYADLGPHDGEKLERLSKLCLEEAINSTFSIDSVGGLDRTFFSEIGRLDDPELSNLLFHRLSQIKSIGEVGQNAIGRLSGPIGQEIDKALASIGQSYSSL